MSESSRYSNMKRSELVALMNTRGYPSYMVKKSMTAEDCRRWLKGNDELEEYKRQKAADEEAHKLTREEVLFRSCKSPDKSALEYPYGSINEDDYSLDDIFKDVLGYPVDKEKVRGFPGNVEEYYWIHEGMNDEESWYALGKLKTGPYFFYKAWCDYTGFDCQGGMDLYAADDWRGLIKMAMSTSDYEVYRADCSVPVSPLESA